MLQYQNIQRHDDIPFADYLKLGGYSHSWLKHQRNGVCSPMVITDNMRMGSLVDASLTETHKVDMRSEFYPACKSIVYKIKEQFGTLIDVFEKQVSFTAEIKYGEFVMKTTGRLDFGLKNHAVIDLKYTTAKDIPALIKFMGYENQGWHYCKMYGVDKFYLMVYSAPLKNTFIYYFDCSSNTNDFWQDKVINFGSVPEEKQKDVIF